MNEEQIHEIIEAFAKAAGRAAEAGADAVQLHGAHGFLISEFLSPYFNRRKDKWGGSDENRFRFVREIFMEWKMKPGAILINTSHGAIVDMETEGYFHLGDNSYFFP